jgi:PmbA protein
VFKCQQFATAIGLHAIDESVDGRFFCLREERRAGGWIPETEEWLEGFLWQTKELRRASPYRPQPKDFLMLGPAVGAALLKAIGSWFQADWIQAGKSPLSFHKGEILFSPLVTLIDDGNYPGGPFSAPFDMEGALTQQTRVVQGGELQDPLYDTYAATRENRLSTGNFLRPLADLTPRIGTSQFYLQPSTTPTSELLKNIPQGVLLSHVESLEPVSGTEQVFGMKGSGWRIAEGHCVEPLREVRLRFEIFDLFRRVTGLGNDLQFFDGFGSPSILFEKIPLSE